MYQQLINRIRITLLIECFATSAIGLVIFIVFLFDDLIEAVANTIVHSSLIVMGGLIFTGTTQIVCNERWLKPISRFLGGIDSPDRSASPAAAEKPSRLPLLLLRAIALITTLIAAFFVIFWGYSMVTAVKMVLICSGGGAVLAGVLYLFSIMDRSPASRPPAEQALRASLSFPLKSAGLSFSMWVFFAVYVFFAARIILNWELTMCTYIGLGAASSGLMAFCIQYFLFKSTLARLLYPILSEYIPVGTDIETFLSIRRKMIASFLSIIVFLLTFTGVLTHYRVTELLKPQMEVETVRAENPLPWESEETHVEPPAPARNPLSRFLIHFLIIGSLAFATSILASVLIANDLSRPVNDLLKVVRRMADGKLARETPIFSEDEIGLLTSTFQRLAAGLHGISRQTAQIAEGDLSLRVEARGDLADSFNRMVDNLGALASRIKEASLMLSTSSSEILASAKEQETGITQQAASITETMATMEELSVTSRQIADNAESVVSVAEETLQAAEEGRQTLIESRKGMDEIRQNTQSIADRILRLNEKSKEIGAIVEMIDEIADKTDLLALNAALEGTKAGEAGKGFSLVAAEMRRLAENVVEMTKEIRRTIREIQDATNSAVMTTESGLKTTEAGVGLMRQTEDSLERIFNRIKNTSEAARQISSATQQQRSGTEQVVSALEEVDKVSKEAIRGTRETTQSAAALAELSEELQKLVARFKVSGEEG